MEDHVKAVVEIILGELDLSGLSPGCCSDKESYTEDKVSFTHSEVFF
jgi:hypothetical protein